MREKGTQPRHQGAETLVLYVDGAMVPLVSGEWPEVKTLALWAYLSRAHCVVIRP
jgi:hypothetical protein